MESQLAMLQLKAVYSYIVRKSIVFVDMLFRNKVILFTSNFIRHIRVSQHENEGNC